MTASYTSSDLSTRVEQREGTVLVSADHGVTWKGFSADEARRFSAGLCVAAERADDCSTEQERAA